MWILMAFVLQNPYPADHPYLRNAIILRDFSSLQSCMKTADQISGMFLKDGVLLGFTCDTKM